MLQNSCSFIDDNINNKGKARNKLIVSHPLQTLRYPDASVYICFPLLMESYLYQVGFKVGIEQSVQRRAMGGSAGIRFPARERFFSSLQCPHRPLGPTSLLSNGYRWKFPRGKETEEWSWPLTPSAEVKNGGAVPPVLHIPSWQSA
jgi:hypothetical protein